MDGSLILLAAWCGPMALSEELAPYLKGIEYADSCSFSNHKWLYQPKGSAFIFFKNETEAHLSISYGAPTGLPSFLVTPTIGILGSSPATAIPLMCTLLSWGQTGIAKRIESDVALAKELARIVKEDERFDLWEGSEDVGNTGIINWRPKSVHVPIDPDAMNFVRMQLKHSWISLTVIDGTTWFRSVAANPNADPKLVFDDVCGAVDEYKLSN